VAINLVDFSLIFQKVDQTFESHKMNEIKESLEFHFKDHHIQYYLRKPLPMMDTQTPTGQPHFYFRDAWSTQCLRTRSTSKSCLVRTQKRRRDHLFDPRG
jgi:hypothetical protein